MRKKIETYWDPNTIKDGKPGCWRACLQDQPALHAAGTTEGGAVNDLLRTVESHEMSGNRDDYEVVSRSDWPYEPGFVANSEALANFRS